MRGDKEVLFVADVRADLPRTDVGGSQGLAYFQWQHIEVASGNTLKFLVATH